jgi:hypothetical protein
VAPPTFQSISLSNDQFRLALRSNCIYICI